jgi:hypothetical protein
MEEYKSTEVMNTVKKHIAPESKPWQELRMSPYEDSRTG